MRFWLYAVALVATPVAAADRFDFFCTTEARDRPGAGWRPSDPIHYRVDLAAGKWCSEACDQVAAVFSSNQETVFFRSAPSAGPMSSYVRDRINLRTGELSIVQYGGGPMGYFLERRGQCKLLEFSGFPKPGAR